MILAFSGSLRSGHAGSFQGSLKSPGKATFPLMSIPKQHFAETNFLEFLGVRFWPFDLLFTWGLFKGSSNRI